jgi:hypothetical protein
MSHPIQDQGRRRRARLTSRVRRRDGALNARLLPGSM